MKAYRFAHLNVHSHYSIMNGCASIRELVDAAIQRQNVQKFASTDNGNMFGIMRVCDYVSQINIAKARKARSLSNLSSECELYLAKENGSRTKRWSQGF